MRQVTNYNLITIQQVTIILKDVNDVKPIFITPNETSVSENIPINTVMMAVKAIDRDEGRNGYIEYSLESNSSSIPFTLGSVDGLLRVSGRLDREAKANYELTVTARDRGEPPKSTSTKIVVKILDENDNSPVFDPKHYSASVAENASIGASVLQVSERKSREQLNVFVNVPFDILLTNLSFSLSHKQQTTLRSQQRTSMKVPTAVFASRSQRVTTIVILALVKIPA